MKRDKDGKIILTDKENEAAAEAILNKWLREDQYKNIKKGPVNEK